MSDALIPRAIIKRSSLVVLALFPTHRRCRPDRGADLDAFYADAVSALWELTMSWSGAYRPYAAGDLLSQSVLELRTAAGPASIGTALGRPVPPTPWTASRHGAVARAKELLAAALADAIEHGLNLADAAVLLRTRVLGMSSRGRRPCRDTCSSSSATEAERHRSDGGLRCARRRPSPISALRSGRHRRVGSWVGPGLPIESGSTA